VGQPISMRKIVNVSLALGLTTVLSATLSVDVASASPWSSWYARCKGPVMKTWIADYSSLYRVLGTTNHTAQINAANVLGLLGSRELACANSPDATLNQQITSLTYFQTVAMLDVKSFVAERLSLSTTAAAFRKMYAEETKVLTTLEQDIT